MNQKQITSQLDRIELRLILLSRKVDRIMATLDDILQVVTDEEGQINSVVALIAGLQKQIADALAGATLPPAVQAKVDAVFAQATKDSQLIVAALNANPTPELTAGS